MHEKKWYILLREYLRVGRQTDAGDLGNLGEERADGILLSVERKVTNEKSIALLAADITVALSAVVGAVAGVGLGGLSVGVVQVEGTTVNLLALHGIVGLGGVLSAVEVNVTETTAAAGVLVGNNTGADEAIKGLEGLVEGVIVDTPAEGASEEGCGSVVISLGLLGGSINLLLSLALLGRSLSLGLLLLIGVRVVAVVRVLLYG